MVEIHRRCCGIDVHKKSLAVCVSLWEEDGRLEQYKRLFGTMTSELRGLGQWLAEQRVTHVGMEATGVYWEPVWNVLEPMGFQLLLVNPEHYKALRGRKTDLKDGERLCEFLQLGQLEGSFIPPPPIRALRVYTRYRARVAQERATLSNRVQKLLEQANVKLASVASDVLGVSGRRMLRALAKGYGDPETLAELARGKLREKLGQLREALNGCVLDYHRVMLRELLANLQEIERRLGRIDERIEALLAPYAAIVERWQQIPGVDRVSAAVLLAEIGPDAAQFPTAAHLSSWAGICPGNHQSGQKRGRGTTRGGNRWLRRTLCQAAWAASHTKQSYLAAQFRHLAGRRGYKRAVVAVANSILEIAYHLLERGCDYQDLGADYFDRRRDAAAVARRLTKRLQALGFEVTLAPATPSVHA